MAWAVAEGDHARRADDPEPAIDREAAARLRGVHRLRLDRLGRLLDEVEGADPRGPQCERVPG